jgi:hypothetical protein
LVSAAVVVGAAVVLVVPGRTTASDAQPTAVPRPPQVP